MSTTNYRLLTYRDVLDHVLDATVSGDRSARNQRSARRAIDEAYRELVNKREWNYYNRRYQFASPADQTTGTVAFDYSGGTYERMLTLTGATWPTNAVFYEVIINSVRYEIEDYKSTTVVTLTERANPRADIASGTTYTLAQSLYPLPDDFQALDTLMETSNHGWQLKSVSLDWLIQQRGWDPSVNRPKYYCTVPSPAYSGAKAIMLAPSPSAARTYEMAYRARPRPLRVDLYATGTASCTSGSAVITGASTVWTSAMVGCVLRISSDGNAPASLIGGLIDSNTSPYAEQGVIKTFTTATSVTLEQAVGSTLATKPYTISDRIDIDAGAMQTYFLRLCEAHFCVFEGRKDAGQRLELASSAFREAAWADIDRRGVPYPEREVSSLADLANSVTTYGGNE